MRWKAPYFLISQDTRGSCPWGLKDSIAILCCCQRIEMMEAHQLVEMKYILFLVVVVHPNFLWVFGLCKLSKTFILFFYKFLFHTYQMTFVIVEDCKALKCLQISQKFGKIWKKNPCLTCFQPENPFFGCPIRH